MEEVFLRFGHLAQDIFGSLTNKDLVQSREVNRMWKHFIDVEKILQIRRIQNFVKPAIGLKKLLQRSTVEEIKEMTSTIQKFQEICNFGNQFQEMWKSFAYMFPPIEVALIEDDRIVLKLRFFKCPLTSCNDSYREKSEVELHITDHHGARLQEAQQCLLISSVFRKRPQKFEQNLPSAFTLMSKFQNKWEILRPSQNVLTLIEETRAFWKNCTKISRPWSNLKRRAGMLV
jgi:hypothetical protein